MIGLKLTEPQKINIWEAHPLHREWACLANEYAALTHQWAMTPAGSQRPNRDRIVQLRNLMSEWNPLAAQDYSNLEGINALRARIKPAKVVGNALHRINDTGIDSLYRGFHWGKTDVVLRDPTWLDDYITFHAYESDFGIKPSIAEVLTQLPRTSLREPEPGKGLYFVTDAISDRASICIAGKVFIAVTSIFTADVPASPPAEQKS